MIADADGIVSQPFNRKVLTELSVDKIAPLKLVVPMAVRPNLTHEDGSVLASMTRQVALAISLEIQPGDATATMHRILPDPRVYRPSFPHDVAREPCVH